MKRLDATSGPIKIVILKQLPKLLHRLNLYHVILSCQEYYGLLWIYEITMTTLTDGEED